MPLPGRTRLKLRYLKSAQLYDESSTEKGHLELKKNSVVIGHLWENIVRKKGDVRISTSVYYTALCNGKYAMATIHAY